MSTDAVDTTDPEAETVPRNPVVEFDDVGKSFGGNKVLEGVNLSVTPGFTGLIGPNGAGKTTCLNVVSGYLRPDTGDVRLAGRSVLGLSPTKVARLGVSRTFQTPRLIPNLSAVENVMIGGSRHYRHGHLAELFGLPAARRDEHDQRERAYTLLETFGLGQHPDRAASQFPIGSQKIIEVTRALLNDPVLLLLDEPAAGLGVEDVDTLVAGLNGWMDRHRDAAVMIIEHDLELITRLCPTAAVLHFGRIIQAGPPKDVLRDPVVVEAYLGADVAAGD
jgi:branched-chain amino acid transport system ATP-binding protein